MQQWNNTGESKKGDGSRGIGRNVLRWERGVAFKCVKKKEEKKRFLLH